MWQRFSSSRLGRFLQLDSLPQDVGASEGISRFLLRRDHYAPTTGRVKPSAVKPRRNDMRARFETSVHRTDGLAPENIWLVGYRHVEDLAQGRRIRARAYCTAGLVIGQALQFHVNGRPYPRHADIIGWPNSEDERLMRATEIANAMELAIDPRP